VRIVLAENIEYTLGTRDLLEEVGLELRHRDRLALVGANGSGKTTLLRLLTGELQPSRGRVQIPGGIHLELLPQDPLYNPDDTIETILKSGFTRVQQMESELSVLESRLDDPQTYHHWEELHQRFEAVGGYQQRSRYEAVLKGLRFAGREQDKVGVLSGGELRRLALGALLLSGSDALLLDEPTNHLDIEMVEWLVSFLQAYGGATVTVSHDRKFLDRVTRQVAWLRRGKLRLYGGNYTAFRQERAIQEEQEAKEYTNWLKEKERREEVLEQARRWAPSSEKHARRMHSLEARMEQFLQGSPAAPQADDPSVRIRFPVEEKQLGPERILEGWSLEKTIQGRKLFSIENLQVRRGERIAIIGPNGAGKTTLLRVLLGLEASDSPAGRIKTGPGVRVGYYDQKLSGGWASINSPPLSREGAGRVRADPELTLFETLYRLLGEKAHAALGGWMFPYEAQFKQVKNLSGGERARLALLFLSLQQANLLILDEPTNHLDLETVEALEQALLRYPGTLLLVSHDLFFLDQLATRTWHIRGGQFDDYPAAPEEYLERRSTRVVPERQDPSGFAISPAPPGRGGRGGQERRVKGKWHLEREKERLESLMAHLEAQIKTVHTHAEEPGLHYSEYDQIAREQARLEAELDKVFQDWGEVMRHLEQA